MADSEESRVTNAVHVANNLLASADQCHHERKYGGHMFGENKL